MGGLLMVLIILVASNYSTCESSVETLNIHYEQNSDLLDQDNQNTNHKSPNEMLALGKFTTEETPSHEDSQLPLMRLSRTVLHKPSSCFHSKHKKRFDPFIHFKKHKSGIVSHFLVSFGGVLKGFMIEIEKVLNWWDVAVKNLKAKMNQERILIEPNYNIEMMDQEFPTVKNKILELMGFIFEFFNLSGNGDYQYPSKRICIDIKGSLNKIKNMASSFIMLLKESQLMESYSDDKLSKIQSYFNSIPADQCAILDYGLVNGYRDRNVNGMFDKNLNYNDEVDIFKSQSQMIRIMWEYINQLPAILTMIFEIIGELFSEVDRDSISYGLNAPNQSPSSHQPPVHYRTPSKQYQHSCGSQLGIDKSHNGNKFPSKSRPLQISKYSPMKVILDGLHAKSLTKLKSSYDGSNIQLIPGTLFSDAEISSCNGQGGKLQSISLPSHDFSDIKLPLDISTVLSLLRTQQLTIGDIVIFNLTEDIILVGKVEDAVNPMSFNVIHRTMGRKLSSTHGTFIWNLSQQDIASNQPIYNDIIRYLACI